MNDELVLGLIKESELKEYGYTIEEIEDLWHLPVVSPEIGMEVGYDFAKQIPTEPGSHSTPLKKELAIRKDQELCAPQEIRDELIEQRVAHGYRLNYYTAADHGLGGAYTGPEAVFISKNYKRTISLWNHDNADALTDTVHISDICYFSLSYFIRHETDYGVSYGEIPKVQISRFLSLFSFDGALGICGADNGRWYRGALLEALKHVYKYYLIHMKDNLPFDEETILVSMRIVQEVPPCGFPMFHPVRSEYDCGFDETMEAPERSVYHNSRPIRVVTSCAYDSIQWWNRHN